MSTIAEALKKVEKKREPLTAPYSSPSQPGAAQPQINITHVTQNKVSYFFVGALILVVFVAGIIFTRVTSSKAHNQTADDVLLDKPVQVAKVTATPVVNNTPAPNVFSQSPLPIIRSLVNESNFRLSGIIFSEDDASAIINNEIVKEGDTIGGATVEFIDRGSVTLSYQGKDLTLKVR